MNKVELAVNGKRYEGWKDVTIKRSIKALSGVFNLSITDRWSGQFQPWIVKPGDECVLTIDGSPVITGFVDTASPSYDESTRTIAISGRDKTADFVDCSIDTKQNQYLNVSLKRIAEIFAKPFGLSVVFEAPVGATFSQFTINQGETAFEALERAARQRGVLLTTDGKGNILVTTPGRSRASNGLEQGKNIKSASATFDHTERFSSYKVKGNSSNIEDEIDVGDVFSVQATATDPVVKRFRPMVLVNDNITTPSGARTRARWEATVRAARASKFSVGLQGWNQLDGSLWRPNQIVILKSPWLGADGEYLITDVTLSLNDTAGSTASLALEGAESYKPEPFLEKTDPIETLIRNSK